MCSKLVATHVADDGTAASRKAAEQNGREIQNTFANRRSSKESTLLTLEKAIADLVLAKTLAGKSDATLEIIADKAARLFEVFGPDCRMYAIDRQAAKAYLEERSKPDENGNVPAATTLYREFLILKQAFNEAGIPHPEWPEIPDAPPSRDRILEVPEQIKLLAAVAPQRRVLVQAYLQLGGMRKSEPETISRVNWKTRMATINGTKTRRSVREAPIPDGLYELMKEMGDPFPGFEPWANADRDLRAACVRAEIPIVSFNDLRRTYATFMARSGCPQLLLARYMGTSVKMIDEVYARLEAEGEHHLASVRKGVPDLERHKRKASKAIRAREALAAPIAKAVDKARAKTP